MLPTASEFDPFLSNVINHQVDLETLEALATVARSPETSKHFVKALLASHSLAGNVDAAAVYSSMRILEEIAEKSALIACIFMAHLWLHANAQQMHDVCDSIDLWLSNSKARDLREHLLMLANSQGDDGLRRH